MTLETIYRERKDRWTSLRRLRKAADRNSRTCPSCGEIFRRNQLLKNRMICPDCGHYFTMSPRDRIALICDRNSFRELYSNLESSDPLAFPGYREKLEINQKKTGQKDAFTAGEASIGGIQAAVGILNCEFLMGSMGTAAGEKIALLADYARDHHLPLLIYSASGGARMQEGLFSLMQMAKTAAAVEAFRQAGGLFLSFMTNPTSGGVTASYASLGDVILAEPDALICFAGPRVIEQTIGEALPEGFQHAEFLLDHGMIDKIVPRDRQRRVLYRLLRLHGYGSKETDPGKMQIDRESINLSAEKRMHSIKYSSSKAADEAEKKNASAASSYEKVQLARSGNRPCIREYIEGLFEGFVELHGDRLSRDDPAVMGGIAEFHGIPITVIGHRKGKTTRKQIQYNFGMASPEGYRKAKRLMEQAEKFHRPVICFIDTPGAYPGPEAESSGQANAIAENLAYMSRMKTPCIAIVTGEGSSGGALAIGVADQVWMLENAVYSILSPEGFASILWKDASRAAEASELMKLTAQDLKKAGLIDAVIPEGEGLFGRIEAMLKEQLVSSEHEADTQAGRNDSDTRAGDCGNAADTRAGDCRNAADTQTGFHRTVKRKQLIPSLMEMDSEQLVAVRYRKFRQMAQPLS